MIQTTNLRYDEFTESILGENVERGILELSDALDLAIDAECNPWEFALEVDFFERLGVRNSQLRWMMRKGFIEHGRETTEAGSDRRMFAHSRTLCLSAASCFVLTEQGVLLANTLRNNASATTTKPESKIPSVDLDRPAWNTDLRDLSFNGRVIKRYKVPSPNQQSVLSAFEEEMWPCRVDDPLFPHPEIDPKRRLHDTIKSLNRHQLVPLLRFYGDGTGEGVRWGLVNR